MSAVIDHNDDNTEPSARAAAVTTAVRPFYWSVRREFWEHPALWIAPLIAATLILLSFIVNALHLPYESMALASMSTAQLRSIGTGFYGAVAAVIALTVSIVTFMYCLDSLYAERRDRSILFWKSLPVSDVVTVTSKLFVAAVVSPAITFIVAVATQFVIMVLGSIIVPASTGSSLAIWTSLPMLQLTIVLLYALIAQSLWFAPITAWFIFISSGVRRSPFMLALLVPAAVVLVERLAFGTTYLFSALTFRNTRGFVATAFSKEAEGVDGGVALHSDGFNLHLGVSERLIDAADPVHFLSSPQVWVGLAVAAALIAATVWMRRYREPF